MSVGRKMMESDAPSVMPRWFTVPIGMLTLLLLAPFLGVVIIPILLVAPAGFPFVFAAFLGDFRGEQEAYEEARRKYKEWRLPPLWEPDHIAPRDQLYPHPQH
jgi:hypothetical protein